MRFCRRVQVMRRRGVLDRTIAWMLVLGFLFAPTVALADTANQYFRKGKKYELSQQWDLAAEQYALALNKRPADPEFKFHLVRALTNASLMFMDRRKNLAEQKDYEGA